AKESNRGCLVRCKLGQLHESSDAGCRRKFGESHLLRLRIRTRWRDQICAGHAFQGGVKRARIVEVARHDRGRRVRQSRSIFGGPHHRTNADSATLELLENSGSRISRRTGDENQILSWHLDFSVLDIRALLKDFRADSKRGSVT